jgi:two-component system sensor histidine kinase FlrB
MNLSSLDSMKAPLKKWYRVLILAIIIIIQVIVYFSLYDLRGSSSDLDDAAVEFAIASGILILIVFFRKSIEKSSVRVPMQIGWSIILIGVVHTGLIQLVELNAPRQEGILNTVIQTIHHDMAVILGGGFILVIIGFYVWVSDISARERRFYSVISAMPVGVAVIDPTGEITLYNDRFPEILGLEKDVIKNSSLEDLLQIDFIKLRESSENTFDVPVEHDTVLEDESGSKKYLSIIIVAHRDKNAKTTSYIVVLSNVTTRKRTEEEREQQRRVISLYASLLTHDVGNDLQAVLGYVEGASITFDQDREKSKAMLRSAEAAGQRMSNLIKTFKIESIPAHIEVVAMLKDTARRAELAHMGLKIHLDADPDTVTLRSPGGSLLPTAIENIFRNTAQHASEHPEVYVHVSREEENLVISISDNGPGISADLQNSLFNRSDPRRENGLGLYLTKQIIIACGGTIELDTSAKARGASYKIRLPLIE